MVITTTTLLAVAGLVVLYVIVLSVGLRPVFRRMRSVLYRKDQLRAAAAESAAAAAALLASKRSSAASAARARRRLMRRLSGDDAELSDSDIDSGDEAEDAADDACFGFDSPACRALRARLISLNADFTSCATYTNLVDLLNFIVISGGLPHQPSPEEALERCVERKILPSTSAQRYLLGLDSAHVREAAKTGFTSLNDISPFGRVDPRSLPAWKSSLCIPFERQFNIDERIGKWFTRDEVTAAAAAAAAGNDEDEEEESPAGLSFRQTLLILSRTLDSHSRSWCRRFVLQDENKTEALVIDVWSMRSAVHDRVPLIEIGFSFRRHEDEGAAFARMLASNCPGDKTVQPVASTLPELEFAQKILWANHLRLPRDYVSARKRKWGRDFDSAYAAAFEPSFILPICAPVPLSLAELRARFPMEECAPQTSPAKPAAPDPVQNSPRILAQPSPRAQQQKSSDHSHPEERSSPRSHDVASSSSSSSSAVAATTATAASSGGEPSAPVSASKSPPSRDSSPPSSGEDSKQHPPMFVNSPGGSPMHSGPPSPLGLKGADPPQPQKQPQADATSAGTATATAKPEGVLLPTAAVGVQHAAAPKHKKICAKCGKSATGVCARCRRMRYCSVECQIADWPVHKKHCVAPAAGPSGCRAASSGDEAAHASPDDGELSPTGADRHIGAVVLNIGEPSGVGVVVLPPPATSAPSSTGKEPESIVVRGRMVSLPGSSKRLVLVSDKTSSLQIIITPASSAFAALSREISRASHTAHVFWHAKRQHKESRLEIYIRRRDTEGW